MPVTKLIIDAFKTNALSELFGFHRKVLFDTLMRSTYYQHHLPRLDISEHVVINEVEDYFTEKFHKKFDQGRYPSSWNLFKCVYAFIHEAYIRKLENLRRTKSILALNYVESVTAYRDDIKPLDFTKIEFDDLKKETPSRVYWSMHKYLSPKYTNITKDGVSEVLLKGYDWFCGKSGFCKFKLLSGDIVKDLKAFITGNLTERYKDIFSRYGSIDVKGKYKRTKVEKTDPTTGEVKKVDKFIPYFTSSTIKSDEGEEIDKLEQIADPRSSKFNDLETAENIEITQESLDMIFGDDPFFKDITIGFLGEGDTYRSVYRELILLAGGRITNPQLDREYPRYLDYLVQPQLKVLALEKGYIPANPTTVEANE